ncbi:MAG: acyltransferase family protein [Clostridiales bacterium]|nr:acyltransferase family protein [Clostridiales bacterium]
MENRIQWADVLKGIGIIFVILGHAPKSGRLFTYIFSFHMPLFFFISGYLFSLSRYPKTLDFIKSRIKSLLIPYCWFSLISIIIFIFTSLSGPNKNSINFLSILKSFILAKRNFIFYNVPLWFLPSLFAVEIVYYLLKKYIKNNFLIIILLLISGYIGVIKLHTLGTVYPLPWGVDAGMWYIFFYGIANIIREIKCKTKYLNILKPILFLSSIILTLLLYFKPHIYRSIFASQLVNISHIYLYIYNLQLALIGIFTYIAVSKLLVKSKILNYLGKHTLTFFSLHVCFGFTMLNKLLYMAHVVNQANDIYGILYTILVLNILTPISYIINKYVPFILGKPFKWHNENLKIEI